MKKTEKPIIRNFLDKQKSTCRKCHKPIYYLSFENAWVGDWYTADIDNVPWCLTDSDDHLPNFFLDYTEALNKIYDKV